MSSWISLDGEDYGLARKRFDDGRVYDFCFTISKKNKSLCKLYVECRTDCNIDNHAHMISDGHVLVEISKSSSILKDMLTFGWGSTSNPFQMTIIDNPPSERQINFAKGIQLFETTLNDNKMISIFANHIRNCVNTFSQSKCYSPYFVLAQSSGTGKTRLLLEAGQEEPIVFINCRLVQDRPPSKGFEYLMNSLINVKSADETKDNNKPDLVCNYFESISYWVFRHLLSKYNVGSFNLESAQSSMRAMTRMFFDRICSEDIWNEIIALYESKSANVKELFSNYQDSDYLKWIKARIITIAFDEASPLATTTENGTSLAVPLRIVRRAAKQYNSENKLAFILSGTSSKMANFSPPYVSDPSIRFGQGKHAFRLFPLFILKCQDTFVPTYTRNLMEADNLYSRIQNRQEDKDFYFLGRPLWGSEYQVGGLKILSDLILMAESKLTCGDLSWLAVLMIRVAVNLFPLSQKADDLVASNMATLHEFSRKENALLISYISEPTLAMGASSLMRHSSVIRKNVLTSLSSVSNFEMENIGTRGEYIFQLVCIDAVDKITNHFPVKPIKLSDFLSCLFGSETFKFMRDRLPGIDTETCLLSLLQFKYFEYDLNSTALRLALIRGIGVVAKRGNAGFDICIPFIRQTGKNLEEVSGLFIEVKNTADRFTKLKKFELLKEEADNITKNGIKVLVNLRRGVKDNSPPFYILEDIFHIDHFCAKTEVDIPEEYTRLLAQSTKYSKIAALRSKNLARFKSTLKYKQPKFLDLYQDLGMTCMPYEEYAAIMDKMNEEANYSEDVGGKDDDSDIVEVKEVIDEVNDEVIDEVNDDIDLVKVNEVNVDKLKTGHNESTCPDEGLESDDRKGKKLRTH